MADELAQKEFEDWLKNCKHLPNAFPPRLMCIHAYPEICEDCRVAIENWQKDNKTKGAL